jgi:predicted alpha/beta superfamily hydrolase
MTPAFSLPSPETGTTYTIYVEAPRGKPRQLLPVVLFLDGDNQFRAAVTAYRALRRRGAVPPLLLVGVGYGASYGQPANRRARDYSPTRHPGIPEGGGADAFLRFLRRTLRPELRRRYQVDAKVCGIAGHSLGSLLVLHALFCSSPAFTHHLASAPSIWWGRRSILRLAARRRARSSRLTARLFLSCGGRDSRSMRDDLGLLLAQLADKPFAGLDTTVRGFPRHTHFNVLRVAFEAGLEALFGSRKL